MPLHSRLRRLTGAMSRRVFAAERLEAAGPGVGFPLEAGGTRNTQADQIIANDPAEEIFQAHLQDRREASADGDAP